MAPTRVGVSTVVPHQTTCRVPFLTAPRGRPFRPRRMSQAVPVGPPFGPGTKRARWQPVPFEITDRSTHGDSFAA